MLVASSAFGRASTHSEAGFKYLRSGQSLNYGWVGTGEPTQTGVLRCEIHRGWLALGKSALLYTREVGSDGFSVLRDYQIVAESRDDGGKPLMINTSPSGGT